jgi:ribosome-interacting GTPase 1
MSDPDAIEKKIQELEHEMSRTQKNKATNYRECHWMWLFGERKSESDVCTFDLE